MKMMCLFVILILREFLKLATLEIFNSVLMDWSSEQQNITHITVLGTKNSILFTESSRNGMLKY